MSTDDLEDDLETELEKAVERNLADAILLSGGLDTGILATLASKHIRLRAFTASLKGRDGTDLPYARLIAHESGIKHYICRFDAGEAFRGTRDVVRIVKSFDPVLIRNNVAIHLALKPMKRQGVREVMTGDGADELFAGYDYMI